MKLSLKELKDLFTTTKIQGYSKISKHQMSKKAAKHIEGKSLKSKMLLKGISPAQFRAYSKYAATLGIPQ